MENEIPKELMELCRKVKAKRAKTVIDHILKYGSITTEELKETYKYDHPPRAIMDVKDQGIPLIKTSVTSKSTGRKIGSYTFDTVNKVKNGRIGGRTAFPKNFKDKLISKYGERITTTNEELESRYLQIDHRVPYDIAGNEADLTDLEEFMLLDASAQRLKSWSCEHCENFIKLRDAEVCRSCFWAYPEEYTHIAMSEQRTLTVSWKQGEIDDYNRLCSKASEKGIEPQALIKELIKKY